MHNSGAIPKTVVFIAMLNGWFQVPNFEFRVMSLPLSDSVIRNKTLDVLHKQSFLLAIWPVFWKCIFFFFGKYNYPAKNYFCVQQQDSNSEPIVLDADTLPLTVPLKRYKIVFTILV